MTRLTIIAAVARNGVIGHDGGMPWHLPDELAHFKATTMGHIKRGDLDAAMVLVPPPSVLKTMSKQMQPLLDKQIAIARQRKTLEKLRDTLLPKLMSGEVRVAY